MTIGERIKALREEHNISQETMSYEINVSRQTISKWENDSVLPDSNNISVLCKYFDVSADYLINGIEYNKEKVNVKISKFEIIIHSIGIFIGAIILVFGILCETVPALKDRLSVSTGSSMMVIPVGIILIICGSIIIFYNLIRIISHVKKSTM